MSETYRDDLSDVGHGSDALWLGLRHNVVEQGYGSDQLQYFERGELADVGYGSDEVRGMLRFDLADHGFGSDELTGAAHLRNNLVDHGRGRDELMGSLLLLLEDSGTGSDALSFKLRHNLADAGRGADELRDQRFASDFLADAGRGRDALVWMQRDFLEDLGHGADELLQRMRVRDFLADTGLGADELLLSLQASTAILLADRGRGSDELRGFLQARDSLADHGTGWDEVQQSGDFGQAWTANMDNWAMSRYAPFTALGAAVIDGVPYLLTADGVYALEGEGEPMTAFLASGKLDMTGSTLAHPLEAHLEYELAGATAAASVDVTSTQSGQAQSWNYPLRHWDASELTNNRARFGRGLRGRHFAYTLRLSGERSYINDWSVLLAPSKRSL